MLLEHPKTGNARHVGTANQSQPLRLMHSKSLSLLHCWDKSLMLRSSDIVNKQTTLTDLFHTACSQTAEVLSSRSCRANVVPFQTCSFLSFPQVSCCWSVTCWLGPYPMGQCTLKKDGFCTVRWRFCRILHDFERKCWKTVPCGRAKGAMPGKPFDIWSWVYWRYFWDPCFWAAERAEKIQVPKTFKNWVRTSSIFGRIGIFWCNAWLIENFCHIICLTSSAPRGNIISHRTPKRGAMPFGSTRSTYSMSQPCTHQSRQLTHWCSHIFIWMWKSQHRHVDTKMWALESQGAK